MAVFVGFAKVVRPIRGRSESRDSPSLYVQPPEVDVCKTVQDTMDGDNAMQVLGNHTHIGSLSGLQWLIDLEEPCDKRRQRHTETTCWDWLARSWLWEHRLLRRRSNEPVSSWGGVRGGNGQKVTLGLGLRAVCGRGVGKMRWCELISNVTL
ncbi:hypothetical protein BDV26DRAFT_160321 [Aspergillus bertholletiae]|uniref:Uncharacterized protein n=1 Tax=Aspergillus bertholletiae TaxID=1226010 RepID=A0A5N7BN31_9EURO|nr:hypothetical protein BDV26DRAFT_160321 [Aspergillus bertholletiae]